MLGHWVTRATRARQQRGNNGPIKKWTQQRRRTKNWLPEEVKRRERSCCRHFTAAENRPDDRPANGAAWAYSWTRPPHNARAQQINIFIDNRRTYKDHTAGARTEDALHKSIGVPIIGPGLLSVFNGNKWAMFVLETIYSVVFTAIISRVKMSWAHW